MRARPHLDHLVLMPDNELESELLKKWFGKKPYPIGLTCDATQVLELHLSFTEDKKCYKPVIKKRS